VIVLVPKSGYLEIGMKSITTARTHMDTERQPKAYSYKRFSTPAQEHGDSLRRQTEMAEAWAARAGVPLDTELNLTDKGVSAYTGANMDVGNLGAFLRAVDDGTVPKGSWLLVENLDRLSREPVFDAQYMMQGIIRAGVTVVDLSDNGREYNTDTLRSQDGLMQLIAMLLAFARGNQESEQKARRVGEAYAHKRTVFASNQRLTKPYTKRLPAWITWDDSICDYALIEERADLLRWMFEMADDGLGVHSIAAHLNEAKEETWGAGGWKAAYWHRSYIRKLLTNKAAIGIFTPHTVRKVDGKRTKERKPQAQITHRFPAAVDRELFERVNARFSTTAARGKNTKVPVRSIFAGVLKCEHCGKTVTRVGKGTYVYLVCAAAHAKAGTCRYESVPYDEAEAEVRRLIEDIVEEAPRGKNTADIEREIDGLQAYLDETATDIKELLRARIEDKSAAAQRALREAEEKYATIADTLRDRRDHRDTLTSTNVKTRLDALEKAFTADAMDTETANKVLRAAVRKIVMKPAEGTLDIYWHHADEPQEVRFVTRRLQSPFEAVEGYSP
jgi:DNA invertase Pin-like site-specific DNA recombinase